MRFYRSLLMLTHDDPTRARNALTAVYDACGVAVPDDAIAALPALVGLCVRQ